MTDIRKGSKLLALLAGGALVLGACGGSGGQNGSEDEPDRSGGNRTGTDTITHAYEQEFVSYNANTASDNAAHNSIVLNQVILGFWYFDDKGDVTPDPRFGTYEKVSDSPLTVDYKINPKATWSDGTPIDCDDILLTWAASRGDLGFSTAGSTGVEDVELPDCEAGDKNFTYKYTDPFVDWESNGPGNGEIMPAHVVAEKGGLSETELIKAIKDGDETKLKKAVDFYNSGFVMSKKQLLPPDVIPSSGPYKLSEWDPGQSITLTANDKFWGKPPKTKNIVIRFISQEEQAQALQNREIQIAEPQPNPDLLNQFENMQGVEVDVRESFFYDHLDFNFDSSPFKDKTLREAFAKCVPRKLINDNLIKPMNPEAEVMGVRNVQPFEDRYEKVVGNGEELYAQPDIAGSKRLLQEAGKVGVEVKIGYKTPNPRRSQAVQLIASSCKKAGFDVVDQGDAKFFESGGGLSSNTYDVALFGWVGSDLISGWASTFTTPEACTPDGKENNNGCYSNKQVDDLIQELNQTVGTQEQNDLIRQIEQILWEDLATIPLYNNPSLTAWDKALTGIEPNLTQASVTWNMHEWAYK